MLPVSGIGIVGNAQQNQPRPAHAAQPLPEGNRQQRIEVEWHSVKGVYRRGSWIAYAIIALKKIAGRLAGEALSLN